MDRSFHFVRINKRLAEINGLTAAQHLGKRPDEILPDVKDLNHVYERWQRILDTGEPWLDVEVRGETPAAPGEERTWREHFYPISKNGMTIGIAAVVEQVTERDRALQRLVKSEQRFRALVAASADVVYQMSPDWTEMQYLLGRDFVADTEAPSRSWLKAYIPEEDQKLVMATVTKAIETKSVFELEHRVVRADGSIGWTFSRAIPILDADGCVTEWCGMAADITERKLAEAKLQRSETRYRLLHETMRDAFVQVDMLGRIQDCNDLFCQLVGYSRDELYDMTYIDLTPARWHDMEAAIVSDQIQRRGYSDIYEKEYRRKDGTIVPIELRTILAPSQDGNPAAMFATIRDISERKAHERQRTLELETMKRFLKLGAMSAREIDLGRLLGEVVETAIAMTAADFGNIQLIEPATGDLQIVAQHGFSQAWLEHWGHVAKGRGTCGTALAKAERVIVEDIATSAIFAGTQELAVQLRSNVRAVQSTPLIGWTGKPLGMLSTHHRTPHTWDERTLRLLDLLARQTADIIERKQADEKLRAAYDSFRQLVDRSPFGIYAVDADFRLVQVSDGARKVFENVKPLIGRDFAEVLRTTWPEPFATEALGHFRHTLATGEHYHSQSTVERRADTSTLEAYDWTLERMLLPDGRQGVVCHFYDLSERQRHEEQISLLMRELNHRSKNMLSLISAIAHRTAATSPMDFLARFDESIHSLAAAQDLLVKNEWKSAPLQDLVRSQLGHFADLIGSRITCNGPDLALTPSAAQAIGMAVHELATNAAKYGALSNDTGRVDIVWRLGPSGRDDRRFEICWSERDGPPVAEPVRRGFGSSVISSMVEISVGGKVSVDYDRSGLTWCLVCATDGILADAQIWAAPPSSIAPDATARQRRILIVEDEPLLAAEIATTLNDVGFEVSGPAYDVRGALQLLEHGGCDAAVIDFNLRNETSERVVQALLDRHTPFVVVTGYSRAQLPEALRKAPVINKPYNRTLLQSEVGRCLAEAAAAR